MQSVNNSVIDEHLCLEDIFWFENLGYAKPPFRKKLHDNQNGIFEKEITNPPNPNDWFTMTLVIDEKTVKAYINDSPNPFLIVNKFNKSSFGALKRANAHFYNADRHTH